MLASYAPFLFGSLGYLLSQAASWGRGVAAFSVCLIGAHIIGLLAVYLRYSFCAYGAWLLDLGGYEVPTATQAGAIVHRTVAWYIFNVGGQRSIFLSWARQQASASIELLFRNAKWLEREAAEMHGWFFELKRDRRVLFLIPLFYLYPLKKAFPVAGLYELVLCPWTAKLTYVHCSWLGSHEKASARAKKNSTPAQAVVYSKAWALLP